MFNSIKQVGTLRDGFLVVGAGLYILGYAVWSYNAWRNNLGLLPALQAQYLIAGIVPGLGIWVTYLVFSHKPSLQRFANDWVGHSVKGPRKVISYSFMAVSLLAISVPFLVGKVIPPEVIIAIFGSSVFFLVPILYGGYASLALSSRLPGWYRSVTDILGAYIMPVTFVGFTIFLYVAIWYPNIPQALGGVSPSCAYMDIEKGDLSQETLIALFPQEAIESQKQVVRSLKLSVFFVSSNVMLVKQGLNSPTYEIARRIVRASISC